MICERCGIGRRNFGGACDWCAAPARARFPFWILFRRWLAHSWLAAEVRRGGPVATGVSVGVVVHLLAAAFGVEFRLPFLWQGGFLWSQQWWWMLVPPAWQPWPFAALVGIAYGSLAGLVAGARTAGRRDGETGRRGDEENAKVGRSGRLASPSPRLPVPPSPRLPVSTSPATVTALVAFVLSGWDDDNGTQYRLIAAGLAVVVGRLTTLIWRSPRERPGREGRQYPPTDPNPSTV